MTHSVSSPANNGDIPSEFDEISLIAIVNVLLRHRWMLVLAPLLLAVVAGGSALLKKRTYKATASFVPQAPDRTRSSAVALARQFGINVAGTEGPGQSPQFYADLVRGREVLRQAVVSKYDVRTKEGPRTANLVELYGLEGTGGILPPWRRAVNRLRDDVSASVSRETGVVQLTVSASDPKLAEQIAARLLDLLNRFNLETRQSQALQEGRFLSARLGEAREELRESEEAFKAFLERNRNFSNSPALVFEQNRLQRQVGMRQEIYTALAQSYEQSRIEQVRNTPVLTVVADPEGSAEQQGRGTLFRAVLGLILGFTIAAFLAVIFDLGRRTREEDGDDYREFNRLKEEMLNDLRHPKRLIRRRREPAGATAQ